MFNLIKAMIFQLASIGLGMVETKVSQHKGLTVFGEHFKSVQHSNYGRYTNAVLCDRCLKLNPHLTCQ
jgi:hypothetical protein